MEFSVKFGGEMNLGMNPMPVTTSLKSSDGVPDQFPAGLRVLVVDDDPTCLTILEKMLRNCHYEVTKCSRAEVALKLLRGNKDGFDIVISDVHMPDMDGFKLLEHVGLEMDLPVIMMSADDSKNVVMKGVTHGACDYLIKPVRMEALKNIWQHVIRKRKHEWKEKDLEQSGSVEDGERQQKPSEDIDYSSSANEGSWKSSKKRKDEEDEGEERDDSSALKKARVVWSVDLHQQFVTAVNQLGIDKAVPKKILELMNVPGLTRENVASHLQKYRLYLRRLNVQHHGLGNSFMGPHDVPYGSITSFNGLDLQSLASSGQLPSQSLASIQAAALSRVPNRNIIGYDNSKLSFLEGQQHHNNGKQVNLLHGVPTNMDSNQLATLNQFKQPFGNVNMNVHSQMVQPRTRTQLLNEIGSSHSLNLPSSVSRPLLSQPIPGAMLGRYGINSIRAPPHSTLSQPSNVLDFPSNSGMMTFNPKGMAHEDLSSEMKGSRGFAPNVDVFNELNQNRTVDWGLQTVGSTFEAPQGHIDVAPEVLVQPAFPTDLSSGNIRTPSVSKAAVSATDLGQQLISSLADNSSRIGPEKLSDMSFQNGLFHNQFGQDELISAILKQPQESMVPDENEFGFEEYHLDNVQL